MEDYKEKYEHALENIKRIKAANKDNKELVDFIEYEYPELKESEDERIRKFISHELACLRATDEKGSDRYEELTDAIVWLEKLKYTEEDLDKAYKCADEVQYRRGYEDAKKEIEKQSEQKLAWSEEDENGLGDALWAVKQARTIAKNENEMGGLWYAEKWLKSLKERMEGE